MKRIHISVPEKLLKKLDTQCVLYGYSRAEFIRSLLRRRLITGTMPKNSRPPVDPPESKSGTIPKNGEVKKGEEIKRCKHEAAIGLCKFDCEK